MSNKKKQKQSTAKQDNPVENKTDEMHPGEGMWLVLPSPLGVILRCSNCGATIRTQQELVIQYLHSQRYCYNCGALMKMNEV